MFMFHMVVKAGEDFIYPGVVFEKAAILGVAPFAPFVTTSTENLGGSWLLLANGDRMHIDEGLQRALEIFGLDDDMIEAYLEREDNAPFLL